MTILANRSFAHLITLKNPFISIPIKSVIDFID
jgi:hypothetical protein